MLATASLSRTAPSIPARHQSHGYDSTVDGRLELQKPVNPGFSGRGGDTVGPMDYNPNSDLKFAHSRKTVMKVTKTVVLLIYAHRLSFFCEYFSIQLMLVNWFIGKKGRGTGST